MMNKEVLINGIIKRLKGNCELRPSETLVLINHIEDLQQRIDKARSILCDADSFIMKKEYVKANTRIIKAKKILGGKE